MLLGTCVGFDRLESAAKLGYDYLESNLGHIKTLGCGSSRRQGLCLTAAAQS